MYILFSPSEAKNDISPYNSIDKDSFIFEDLYRARLQALKKYQNYLNCADLDALKKLFGLKKESEIELYKKIDILKAKTNKAILRYSGVGYEYLGYKNLLEDEKEFLDNHLIIFSNLFGPLLAKDRIPLYKLKQGERIDDFIFENFYRENFTSYLDELLKDRLVIDLRASFYDKFYRPSTPFFSMKFLKNSKSVSHWAKAYRGMVAKELAKHKPKNEKELMDIEFKNLKIKEIKRSGLKNELVFDIVD